MQIQVPKVKKSKMHATKRELTKADNNKENPWKLKRTMKMEGNEGGPRGTERETQAEANWQRAREEHRFKYRRASVQGERRVKGKDSSIFSKCPGSVTFHFIPSTNIWEKVLIQQKKSVHRGKVQYPFSASCLCLHRCTSCRGECICCLSRSRRVSRQTAQ